MTLTDSAPAVSREVPTSDPRTPQDSAIGSIVSVIRSPEMLVLVFGLIATEISLRTRAIESSSLDLQSMAKLVIWLVPLVFLVRLPKEVLAVVLRPCLLYTSPSPRDATLSRMPSSA